MFYALQETWCIRRWDQSYILIDTRSGDHFELTDDQAQVLLLCDGETDEEAILSRFDDPNAAEFLKNLLADEILRPSEVATRRSQPMVRSETNGLPLTDALLEITGVCNLKCKHCYNEKFNAKRWSDVELRVDEWQQVVHALDQLGVRRIQLSGGEPFISKKWQPLIEYTQAQQVFIDAIASNATLITDDIARTLGELMGQHGAIYISVDGINAEQHDALRGAGNFDRTVAGIQLLGRYNVNVVINTMLLRTNKDSLLEFPDFIQRTFTNVKGWRIGCPKILGRYQEYWEEFYVPFSAAVEVFVAVLRKYLADGATYRLEMSDFFRTEVLTLGWELYTREQHPCAYAVNNCTIKPNGDVVFCASLEGFAGAYLGNVRDQPLEQIWFSDKHMQYQALQIGDLQRCAACRYVQLCGGGCRSNAWLTYNDIMQPDPRACLSMLTLERDVVPLLPTALQEEWQQQLVLTGSAPVWDTLADVL